MVDNFTANKVAADHVLISFFSSETPAKGEDYQPTLDAMDSMAARFWQLLHD
jgi:hypothetical protein